MVCIAAKILPQISRWQKKKKQNFPIKRSLLNSFREISSKLWQPARHKCSPKTNMVAKLIDASLTPLLNSVSLWLRNLCRLFFLLCNFSLFDSQHCLIITGGGLALGGLVSLLFLRRRGWPVILGGGFGIGVAYTNCEKSLNEK